MLPRLAASASCYSRRREVSISPACRERRRSLILGSRGPTVRVAPVGKVSESPSQCYDCCFLLKGKGLVNCVHGEAPRRGEGISRDGQSLRERSRTARGPPAHIPRSLFSSSPHGLGKGVPALFLLRSSTVILIQQVKRLNPQDAMQTCAPQPFGHLYEWSETMSRKGRILQKPQVKLHVGHVDGMVLRLRHTPLVVLSNIQCTVFICSQHNIKGGSYAYGETCSPQMWPSVHPHSRLCMVTFYFERISNL